LRLLSIISIFIICLTWLFRKDQLSRVLRLCLYLIIPFLTYLSQNSTLTWMNEPVKNIYSISFLVVFFFIILTVRYTRRQKGFKTTPMDFLILFVALILPSISGGLAFTHQIGLLTVKILIFFFGFEILIGELRDDMTALGISTLLSMLIITVNGFSSL
jgi:UDP-GlcNAc:undecaprenyl-phosphate GlcNAc-1-phosphate transferase